MSPPPPPPPDHAARGRRGGQSRSEAKLAAVRRNGLRGGRPPKATIGDRVRANQLAQVAFRGQVGEVVDLGPKRSQFQVQFGDAIVPMMSWWIEVV